MSTLTEAFAAWECSRDSAAMTRDLRGGGHDEAFLAGARWVIAQLDEADRKEGANLGDHFVELARLRNEVRGGG